MEEGVVSAIQNFGWAENFIKPCAVRLIYSYPFVVKDIVSPTRVTKYVPYVELFQPQVRCNDK